MSKSTEDSDYDYHWNVPGAMALGANKVAGKHAPLQLNDDGHLETTTASAPTGYEEQVLEYLRRQTSILLDIVRILEHVTGVEFEDERETE